MPSASIGGSGPMQKSMMRSQTLVVENPADDGYKVASIRRKLNLEDIETRENDLDEKIMVNKDF